MSNEWIRKQSMRGLVTLAGLVAMLAGCAGDSLTSAEDTGEDAAWFQTDSLNYTLVAGSKGHSTLLTVTYTNAGSSPISFANCLGGTNLALEKLVDGQWKSVWAPYVLACMSAPIVVPPGGTHVFKIGVFAGYDDCNCGPRFGVPDVSGTYRAKWWEGVTSGDGSGNIALPEGAWLSNEFTFVAQPR